MNDDLDEEIIGAEENIDGPRKKSKNLGDLWRTNPLVKVGVVLVAGAIIFSAVSMFGGSSDKPKPSDLATSSEVTSTPGLDENAPAAYTQAIEEKNEADLETALQTGGSTLPVPVQSAADRLQLPQDEDLAEVTEDPLMRWRKLQEERLTREIETQVEVEPVAILDSEQQSEAVRKLTEAMSGQIQKLLGGDSDVKTFNYVKMIDYPENPGGQGPQPANAPGADGTNAPGDGGFDELDSSGIEEDTRQEVIIPAGEIEYAQLIIEANSDVPGPVLALLVSGPLSGSKLIGTFTVQEDYLTLNFETVVVDGESYDVSAVALDPSTTLPGMATEVDHRYFRRIVLPAAAAFIEGFADAISETEETQITIDTGTDTTTSTNAEASTEEEVANGIQEAGQEVREILDEMAEDTKTLVKIHAGTPIGVLFTDAVVQEET